ncbi:GNAT family N-acetyltransferase [Marinovum sp. 2_MG-2023]|uniref:GNAT family N-acetyltransferase n=1 Tax=unclassified Marinovum TaxID=2647166 RepID=UPI0026E47AA1|nr:MULTISPECIES: GNAT family N-acetyltransferase [unclassified Marinovum]MDO6730374.1 GNAT family N-acetyltransferase [Marinovum sp. 2_MG-2023]MDO6778354.1 GNAT family N-acetyltransferase [Marinovum sp. 1_MG-2023]
MSNETPKLTIEIRKLIADDKAQWQELWRQYLAFYETELDAAIYDSTFERLLGTDPRDFNALVAEVDGRLVGLTHFLFHRHGWKQEEVCYLQDLYAVPDLRGHGIGRKLMEAVYDAADQAQAPNVYWLTQEFNHTARDLYDRIGVLTPFIKYQRA